MRAISDAATLASRVQRGEVRAAEVALRQLTRIGVLNPALNALVQVDADDVLRQATLIDARCAMGEALPLAGVPISIKDNLWVVGQVSTCGSRFYEGHVAERDSLAVSRLREAGALLIGITNCSEFACKGITDNLVYGTTRHPWAPTLTPGGSSGGAAAAVAVGFGMLALTTDAGGSVRRPAAHCGLVGMKPSTGVIADPWGFPVIGRDLNVIGQIGRCVSDVKLMLEILLGPHPADRSSLLKAFCAPRDVRALRIGVSVDLALGYAIDADVVRVFTEATARLASSGLDIQPVTPRWPSGLHDTPLLAAQHAELAAHFGEAWLQAPERFDPAIGGQIEAGFKVTGSSLVKLASMRDRIVHTTAEMFDQIDLLLCPTVPVEPWPHDQSGPTEIGGCPAGPRDHARFTPLFNQGGLPALSVPCGLGAQALPLGLQIIGPRFYDDEVLAMGAFVERTLALDMVSPYLSLAPDTLEYA